MKSSLYESRNHGTSIFPLQVYSHRDKNGLYHVPAHWHDELEWLYVEEGSLHITARGETFDLTSGHFCFFNAGDVHSISSEGTSLHHAIVFHPSLLDFARYDACQHNFIQPITSGRLFFPPVDTFLPDASVRSRILQELKQIIVLYHTLPRGALLSIKIRLLSVLESLFFCEALLENPLTEKEKYSLNCLKEVIDYIKENAAQPITLEQLSSLAHMSPTYFCHYFKKQTGKTPFQFINEQRIQKAEKLLAGSDLSISQIAMSCGFDNFSYFTRKFREYRHVTPRQYRTDNRL